MGEESAPPERFRETVANRAQLEVARRSTFRGNLGLLGLRSEQAVKRECLPRQAEDSENRFLGLFWGILV